MIVYYSAIKINELSGKKTWITLKYILKGQKKNQSEKVTNYGFNYVAFWKTQTTEMVKRKLQPDGRGKRVRAKKGNCLG